jgi:hypothetical protein
VIQYTSDPIPRRMTLMGIPTLKLNFTTDATDYWIAARFYDLGPDVRAGHRIVLELSQADTPFLRKDNVPSVLSFSGAEIVLPLAPDYLERDFRS